MRWKQKKTKRHARKKLKWLKRTVNMEEILSKQQFVQAHARNLQTYQWDGGPVLHLCPRPLSLHAGREYLFGWTSTMQVSQLSISHKIFDKHFKTLLFLQYFKILEDSSSMLFIALLALWLAVLLCFRPCNGSVNIRRLSSTFWEWLSTTAAGSWCLCAAVLHFVGSCHPGEWSAECRCSICIVDAARIVSYNAYCWRPQANENLSDVRHSCSRGAVLIIMILINLVYLTGTLISYISDRLTITVVLK